MKTTRLIRTAVIFATAFVVLASCNKQQSTFKSDVPLNNEIDSVSYSLGVAIAKNVKTQGLKEINIDAFAKAVSDIYADETLKIADENANDLLNEYFQKLQLLAAEEKTKAEMEFLEKNKAKEGVIALPSGLQYIVIKEGTGPMPAATDQVKVHYHGTLIDGTVFDSSVERGEPVTFPVNGVIPGWQEALKLMPVGSKWTLFIPSKLAYGERGAGEIIGPYSTLIFEVELLGIE